MSGDVLFEHVTPGGDVVKVTLYKQTWGYQYIMSVNGEGVRGFDGPDDPSAARVLAEIDGPVKSLSLKIEEWKNKIEGNE